MTWSDDEGYQEDPEAAPSVEGRIDQMADELRKLLRSSFIATVAMSALIIIWDLVRAQGFATTTGFLIGSSVATLNLWLLAGGFFALLRGRRATPRALLAFGGSFIGLVMLCVFIVVAKREWTFGFALGLATPAIAGILYGRTLRKNE
jgi:hypothetical protein